MANAAIDSQEPTKLLYSVSEAARLLSCSRSTVYSFIKGGQILAVYPTSKARISATSLVRFVEMKEREARDSRAAISQEAK
jgi:excisionase family DNA binding protein